MGVFDNMNLTTSQGVAPGVVDYYERTLLTNAKPEMVHGRDAQKRLLPENNGKLVQYRRMVPYAASTEPLKEGITPAGQEIRQTAFTAMVKPYGRHVELSDEMQFVLLDDMNKEVAQLLSDQATLSLDTICRDALHTGMNVQYAGGRASRTALTAADKLTAAEVKKAVRTLERNNCKPFEDGYFHAIVHPDTVYDLTSDSLWVDVATYQDKEKIEKYELGTMFGVKFFKSTNAKKYEAKDYLYGTTASLTISTVDVADRSVVVTTEISADDARALTGQMVDVTSVKTETSGETSTSVTTVTAMCVERVDYRNSRIIFRWMPETASDWAGATIGPEGTASGVDIYGTLIYGRDAFGNVELGGNGKNVKIIINPAGSSGAADPLEQRGTIAWKVKGFCCVILQDSFMVRIEHAATV